ncbi:hypothetical protein [Treponema pedis]|uniref:hypothetical protein n=1 Tax=Treponema pedis TaxID=409322 RepID=UPI0003FEC5FC|nr:hypothetical protein [Treponema pedis]
MGMQEVAIKITGDAQGFVSAANNISEAFQRITEKMNEAVKAGDQDLAEKYQVQARRLQSMYIGMASGNQTAAGGGIAGFNIAAGGLTNTAQSLIGQLGAGDAAGGALSLAGKGAGLLGKLGTGGAIAGGGLMAAAGIGWGIKKLSDLYTTHDEAAEALNASLNNTMRLRYDLSTEEGRKAWADFNSKNPDRINDFEMTKDGKTMLETLESRYKINTKNIEEAFTNASAAANSFGYSMEEGLNMVKNLTQYGYGEGSYDAARNVFGWAKMMGVQKEEAADFKGMFYRYGNKTSDALAEAYRANNLMGMKEGQYGETLRILQDVFTDGINKGFTKSIAEIGSTMAFLKNGSGNNPLWMGEQGAARYQQLNNAARSATSLSSVTDILSYRAIASLSQEEKEAILKEHGLQSSGDYTDNMMIAELGFIPSVYKKKMKLFEQIAGKGNRSGLLEMLRSDTGFDYIQASQFYDLMQQGIIDKDTYYNIAGKTISPEYTSRVGASKGATEFLKSMVAELGKMPTDAVNWVSTNFVRMDKHDFNMGITPDSRGGSIRSASKIKELQETIDALLNKRNTLYREFRAGKEDELKKITAELQTLNTLLKKLQQEGLHGTME